MLQIEEKGEEGYHMWKSEESGAIVNLKQNSVAAMMRGAICASMITHYYQFIRLCYGNEFLILLNFLISMA